MKLCPYCKTKNPDEARFCKACGSLIPEQIEHKTEVRPGSVSAAQPETSQWQSSSSYSQASSQSGSAQWNQSRDSGRTRRKFKTRKISATYYQQKSGSKKWMKYVWVAVGLSVIACSSLIGVLVMNERAERENRESIESVGELVANFEYGPALAKIEPLLEKNQDAEILYEWKYESQIGLNQKTAAQATAKAAADNLDTAQAAKFKKSKADLDAVFTDEKPWIKVADIGILDMPPIALDGKGWLIRVNGLYEVLDPSGRIHSPDTDLCYASVVAAEGTTFDLFQTEDGPGYTYTTHEGSEKYRMKGQKLEQNASLVILDKDDQLQTVQTGSSGGPKKMTTDVLLVTKGDIDSVKKSGTELEEKVNPLLTDLDLSLMTSMKDRDYYVCSKETGQIYGPIESSRPNSFGKWRIDDGTIQVEYGYAEPYQTTDGAFATPVPSEEEFEREKWTLHDQFDRSSTEGFDDFQVIDSHSIGGFRKKRFFCYDSNLKELYNGFFEGGATPVRDSIPVKIDGSWKLIRFESTDQALCKDTTEAMKKLRDWLPDAKKDPNGKKDLINDLGHLIAGSDYNCFEDQIFINGKRISPYADHSELPEGELLRIEPTDGAITWSANHNKGWPEGETLQVIFYSGPEGDYDVYHTTCSEHKVNGNLTLLRYSEVNQYLSGPVKNNAFNGTIETVLWFEDTGRMEGT